MTGEMAELLGYDENVRYGSPNDDKKENKMGSYNASDKPEKIYCGNGKVMEFKGFSFLKYSLSPEDTKKIAMRAAENNGWVNLQIMKRKEVSEKGMSHYGQIDTWKPKKKDELAPMNNPNEEIPF